MENTNQPQPPQQAHTLPVSKKWYDHKATLLIIILALVAITAVLVYFIENQPQNYGKIVVPHPKTAVENQLMATSTTATSGGQIYTNDRYGYQLSLPPSCSIGVSADPDYSYLGEISIQCEGKTVSELAAVFLTKNGIDAEGSIAANPWQKCTGNSCQIIPNYKPVTTEHIGSYEWTEYSIGNYVYQTEYNGVSVSFQSWGAINDNDLKSIISTFKFISLPFPRLDEVIFGLQPGNQYGDLIIQSIKPDKFNQLSAENADISFSGEVTLTGQYFKLTELGGTSVRFDTLDSASIAKIPQINPNFDYKDLSLYFNNDAFAEKEFSNDEGQATIIIKNLEEIFGSGPNNISFSADLVTVQN